MKKTQIHFTKQQIEPLEKLRRQTGATRSELVRRAVDYYLRGIREHGVQKALLPLPTGDTREALLKTGADDQFVPPSYIKKCIRLSPLSDQESKTHPDTRGA